MVFEAWDRDNTIYQNTKYQMPDEAILRQQKQNNLSQNLNTIFLIF